MTTKHSPLRVLRAQADKIAAILKAAERGEIQFKDGARDKDIVTFSVVMDDKVLQITMAWDRIAKQSEAQLSDLILRQMREERSKLH